VLAVEQQQGAGDAVGEVELVVVQQVAEQRDPLLAVEGGAAGVGVFRNGIRR
jgi:hypothetical protein